MASPQKTKGDVAERQLVAHLQANGFPLARRGKAGAEADLGDIFGIRDRLGEEWCVSVKSRADSRPSRIETSAKEAEAMADRLGSSWWMVVWKRVGTVDVDDWFVWLPAWMLLDAAATRNDGIRIDATPEDLACVTVRTWLLLVAPEAEAVAV